MTFVVPCCDTVLEKKTQREKGSDVVSHAWVILVRSFLFYDVLHIMRRTDGYFSSLFCISFPPLFFEILVLMAIAASQQLTPPCNFHQYRTNPRRRLS